VDPTDPLHLLRLTPTSDPFAFYGSAYNPVTGELFARVTDFVTGANTWYGTIPGPAGAAAVIIGVGLAAARRRRGNG
jgi:MYXO-CTERM domain-containing protein